MIQLHSAKAALAVIGLGILSLAAPASAQTIMQANIPFSFIASDQSLPAGTYNFVISADFIHCQIVASDGSVHPIHFAPGAQRKSNTTLGAGVVQFHKYGDRYFLTQVWKPGNPDGLAAYPSKRMLESAKAMGAAETVNVDSEIK